MKKTVCIILAAITALSLAACQKTPESPIIVGKANDGWKEAALPPSVTVERSIPEKYTAQITEGDLTVNINAAVEYPQQEAFPVYVLQKGSFSQEQADKIMDALIGDAELYDISNGRTKQVVKGEIAYYQEELNATDDQGLTETYQEILRTLMKEEQTAPDEETITPASRELKFKDCQDLSWKYAREVKTDDGGYRYVWTDEARAKAAAAGNEEISGYCTLADGTQKYLSIKNRSELVSEVHYSFPDGSPIPDAAGTIEESDAIAQGNALLELMGVDYELMGSAPVEGDAKYGYLLSYCTAIAGTNREVIRYAPIMQEQPAMSEPLYQEDIQIIVKTSGVTYFTWQAPVSVVSAESENMSFISWEDTASIIEKGLRMKNFWGDYKDESVIARRLDIDKICLSYRQVQKEADLSSTYYIPVWDVIGTMHYVYADDYYTTASDDHYRLDENNERVDYEDLSVLTVNAIDGNIIN